MENIIAYILMFTALAAAVIIYILCGGLKDDSDPNEK